MADPAVPLRCPFCGAPESERFTLEGHRFLVFPCQFSPEVDPTADDAALAQHLATAYRAGDPSFFRGTCDRLHLYVTAGAGGRALTRAPGAPD